MLISIKTGATYDQEKQTGKRMLVQKVGVVERNERPLSILWCTIIVAWLILPGQVFSFECIYGQLFQRNGFIIVENENIRRRSSRSLLWFLVVT